MTTFDWSTATEAGTEHVFVLEAWSGEAGKRQVQEIVGAVRAVLHDRPLRARPLHARQPAARAGADRTPRRLPSPPRHDAPARRRRGRLTTRPPASPLLQHLTGTPLSPPAPPSFSPPSSSPPPLHPPSLPPPLPRHPRPALSFVILALEARICSTGDNARSRREADPRVQPEDDACGEGVILASASPPAVRAPASSPSPSPPTSPPSSSGLSRGSAGPAPRAVSVSPAPQILASRARMTEERWARMTEERWARMTEERWARMTWGEVERG